MRACLCAGVDARTCAGGRTSGHSCAHMRVYSCTRACVGACVRACEHVCACTFYWLVGPSFVRRPVLSHVVDDSAFAVGAALRCVALLARGLCLSRHSMI